MWDCYVKPNRHVHSSGFRCFEVGYCTLDENNKVAKKVVLNTYSDAIHLYDLMADIYNEAIFKVNLDLTKDGYIRLFNHDNNFHWRTPVLSDAILEPGGIDEKWCEEMWEKQNADPSRV